MCAQEHCKIRGRPPVLTPAAGTGARRFRRLVKGPRRCNVIGRDVTPTPPAAAGSSGGLMASDTAFATPSTHTEGTVARSIENQTARLPSDLFLWLAVGSMTVSAAMQLTGKQHGSLFVGQWAPAFLLFGVYNKLVKQRGSDWTSRRA
jgi:hypothetical protein